MEGIPFSQRPPPSELFSDGTELQRDDARESLAWRAAGPRQKCEAWANQQGGTTPHRTLGIFSCPRWTMGSRDACNPCAKFRAQKSLISLISLQALECWPWETRGASAGMVPKGKNTGDSGLMQPAATTSTSRVLSEGRLRCFRFLCCRVRRVLPCNNTDGVRNNTNLQAHPAAAEEAALPFKSPLQTERPLPPWSWRQREARQFCGFSTSIRSVLSGRARSVLASLASRYQWLTRSHQGPKNEHPGQMAAPDEASNHPTTVFWMPPISERGNNLAFMMFMVMGPFGGHTRPLDNNSSPSQFVETSENNQCQSGCPVV